MSVQAMPATGIAAQPLPVALTAKDLKTIDRISGINILVAVLALSIGAMFGVFQGLEHAKVFNIYPFLQPVTVPPASIAGTGELAARTKSMPSIQPLLPRPATGTSNDWPTRTVYERRPLHEATR